MKTLILYFTKTGHTLEAAEAVAEGIRAAGSEVALTAVADFDATLPADCDAFIVASPCWAGSAGVPMFPKPMERALAGLAADALTGKRCGGVSVHAGVGGENTVELIGTTLASKACSDYRPGPVARAGVPFSLWKGPSVKPEDEAAFKAYGTTFAGE